MNHKNTTTQQNTRTNMECAKCKTDLQSGCGIVTMTQDKTTYCIKCILLEME